MANSYPEKLLELKQELSKFLLEQIATAPAGSPLKTEIANQLRGIIDESVKSRLDKLFDDARRAANENSQAMIDAAQNTARELRASLNLIDVQPVADHVKELENRLVKAEIALDRLIKVIETGVTVNHYSRAATSGDGSTNEIGPRVQTFRAGGSLPRIVWQGGLAAFGLILLLGFGFFIRYHFIPKRGDTIDTAVGGERTPPWRSEDAAVPLANSWNAVLRNSGSEISTQYLPAERTVSLNLALCQGKRDCTAVDITEAPLMPSKYAAFQVLANRLPKCSSSEQPSGLLNDSAQIARDTVTCMKQESLCTDTSECPPKVPFAAHQALWFRWVFWMIGYNGADGTEKTAVWSTKAADETVEKGWETAKEFKVPAQFISKPVSIDARSFFCDGVDCRLEDVDHQLYPVLAQFLVGRVGELNGCRHKMRLDSENADHLERVEADILSCLSRTDECLRSAPDCPPPVQSNSFDDLIHWSLWKLKP